MNKKENKKYMKKWHKEHPEYNKQYYKENIYYLQGKI